MVTFSTCCVGADAVVIPVGSPVKVVFTRAGILNPAAPVILKVIGVSEETLSTVLTHNS